MKRMAAARLKARLAAWRTDVAARMPTRRWQSGSDPGL